MTARLRGGARPPEAPFPILPLRTGVVFPGTQTTLTIGRSRSMALVGALRPGDVLAVVSQREPNQLQPSIADLHPVGSFARVVSIADGRSGGKLLTLEGLGRLGLSTVTQTDPFWRGMGLVLDEQDADTDEAHLLGQALAERVREVAGALGGALELPEEADPALIADRVAFGLVLDTDKAAEVLAILDVPARLRRVLELLAEAKTLSELKSKIDRDVRAHFGKQQREAILRQQLESIRRELGEPGGADGDLAALRRRLAEAGLPEETRETAERELGRLESIGAQSPEANVIRTYLDWLVALPWQKRAESALDLDAIAEKLDADHHGLEDVKKRILEHMAVHKLSGNPRGTILCLVGPPGVGKTSLGQSIADATSRPFVRISLGGVRDEAEIRGHRRTYVGALPGRLIHALRKAGVKNPVVLLDEVDKLGRGWAGWPEAALLEVLDPEQNRTFTDHYLETPFDLSEVLFICTANTLDTLSAPLRDRMEVVELSGYTLPEKTHIARKHLLTRRLADHGVPADAFVLTQPALEAVVSDYTREAGVRQLDRELTRIVRSVALRVARATEDAPARFVIDVDDLKDVLGRARFFNEVAERTVLPGVATGLAWTPVGGGILFIETSRMPGKGRLEITGQLGDVMKESARAALTYVRSHAEALGVDADALDRTDLHLHVPAGAVPKDGPSAGVTIFTALVSLLTGRRVRPDTAMTGEVTLRGRVLPVGGIAAKVLAAHRAGLRRVLLPAKNERDLDDLPADVRDDLDILLVSDMDAVLAAALEEAPHDEAAMAPSASGTAGSGLPQIEA
jgi:ATP-dependent Lon protease